MRVLPRILLHLVGQRSDSPVSQLVLLVRQHGAVSLQQVGKAELLMDGSGSLSSVENIYDV